MRLTVSPSFLHIQKKQFCQSHPFPSSAHHYHLFQPDTRPARLRVGSSILVQFSANPLSIQSQLSFHPRTLISNRPFYHLPQIGVSDESVARRIIQHGAENRLVVCGPQTAPGKMVVTPHTIVPPRCHRHSTWAANANDANAAKGLSMEAFWNHSGARSRDDGLSSRTPPCVQNA